MFKLSLYTREEECFIKENFPDKGVKFCMNALNKTDIQIRTKATKLGLHLNPSGRWKKKEPEPKKIKTFKVDVNEFVNPQKPEAVYLLGLIWGDGCVHRCSTPNKVRNTITVSLVKTDFLQLVPIFQAVGDWNFCEFKAKKGKLAMYGYTSNRPLVDYLQEHDYIIKSQSSPEKILKTIPENLKRYFFQGLIDADGCYYHKFSLAAPYNQKWDFMCRLFDEIGITRYAISRRYTKKFAINGAPTGFSHFLLHNKPEMSLLRNYLYPHGFEFGFRRKYDAICKFIDESRPRHRKKNISCKSPSIDS